MKHVFYYLGNTLIVLSLLGFIILFLPVLKAYFFPPQIKSLQSLAVRGMFITIPKIHAQARVIPNVNPWDEKSYLPALQKGVAQAKGTSLPGEKGTVFLFAHSSGPPWQLTYANTLFLRLGELKQGDKIFITRDGKEYTYQVRGNKEVWPTEVNYLLDTRKNQLVLQTCTPIGTSFKRLLVFADPLAK